MTTTRATSSTSRFVALDAAHNTRDLGGYEGLGGRITKWGPVYRSGDLARLTDRDLDKVATMNIATVYDFRSTAERQSRPDRLPRKRAPRKVAIEIVDADAQSLMRRIRSGEVVTVDAVEETRRETCHSLAIDRRIEFGRFLEDLASAPLEPALFHCTSGRDRTGIASALFLLTLGVPEDTVIEDYLLSRGIGDSVRPGEAGQGGVEYAMTL